MNEVNEEQESLYKVGDRVRIRSKDFMENTGKPSVGGGYERIGCTDDPLTVTGRMLEHCGQKAIVTEVFKSLGRRLTRYNIDLTGRSYAWNNEALVALSATATEEERKLRRLLNKEKEFNEELL